MFHCNETHLEPVKILTVDLETIDKAQGIFKCPSELHLDVNYQSIIKTTITRCLIKEQPESDTRKELMEIIEAKIKTEFTLASLRQDPSRVGFKATDFIYFIHLSA